MQVQKNIVRLKGDKISLGPIRSDEEALELYAKWINDETINRYIGYGAHVSTLLDEKKWAERDVDPYEHVFSIVENSTSKLIGTCDITEKYPHARHCCIGILIGEADARNRGCGTECMKILCRYGFNQLNANSISLSVDSDNVRAINCYKNTGFIECGCLHDAVYDDGRYYDLVFMEILRKNWEKTNFVKTTSSFEYGL